ncbi:MAG TPA: FAD:protein FMN transferase [Acidimicrobiales bacterium]|jgi:thiamine biosynthesis lipoprotein|nr:FAD:protein FMN transferase [Acidimicrobiales bacterium]
MGTVVTIDCFLDHPIEPGRLDAAMAAAVAVLHEVDGTFSVWKPDSPMSALRSGALQLADAPDVVREVLAACEAARAASGGWFDPWALPGGVDPTGYMKGWAAQRAVRQFVGLGVRGAIVNAAGDVATLGQPAQGASFRIGVVDPAAPGRLACVATVDGGIATSGTYERGAHLVDPVRGERRTAVASATVCGRDLGLADALATALAVGGEQVLGRIEALRDIEAFTIGHDGAWSHTSAFPFAPGSTRCATAPAR